jgi:hypothetical protein
MVVEKGRVGLVMMLKSLGIMTGDLCGNIGATDVAGEFGNSAGEVTLNLNACHDKVTNGVGHAMAGIIE